MKILIIEDEPELRKSIKRFLYEEGYVVESANDYPDASEKISTYDYDIILVDITLPNGNGLKLIQQLKEINSKSGIIIISAKDSLDDKVKGLDLGADDYLTKPFHLAELNSRIKALSRRKNFDGQSVIIFNEITINPESKEVKVKDQIVPLTTKEFELLIYFISNKNRVLSKNNIAEHLWGDDADMFDNYDFIYVHIRNLRKKLLDAGAQDYIQTIYGIGYKFKS
ncbi:MAG TPA: response regulator transcription factor [Bacteroidia bacterium]|jgi:DNA-binding response OmpR family regulator|nr:response regulator transcription factor [Bacteroidia bacterium]